MKRSFKLATAFTGVAAVGAIVAPTANAATVAPNTTRVTPDLAGAACPDPISTHGLILYYQGGTHTPACFTGDAGHVNVGGNPAFSKYCDGSATGYLYINKVKHAFTTSFHPLYGQHVSEVSVTGYNRNLAECTWG